MGTFPRSILEDTTIRHKKGTTTRVKAVHDYVGGQGELSFPLGARMFVVGKAADPAYWNCVYNNEVGLVPATHIASAEAEKEGAVQELQSDSDSDSDGGDGKVSGKKDRANAARAAIVGDLAKVGGGVVRASMKVKKSVSANSSPAGNASGDARGKKRGSPVKNANGDNIEKPQAWDWGKVPKLRAERELTGFPNGTSCPERRYHILTFAI